MKARELVGEIDRRLNALLAPTTESIRQVRREFSRRLKLAAAKEVVALATTLRSKGHLHRLVAYELLLHHREALSSLRSSQLQRLGSGIDSWGAVDTFACYLAGPVWRERQVPDRAIHQWARSKDRWWRRAALVSTVPLNSKAHGGTGDAARTLRVCRLLLPDRDDMVVKAMSWALRELSKRDPTAVRAFLHEHRDTVAPRVQREVRNKLVTGLKNPNARQRASVGRAD